MSTLEVFNVPPSPGYQRCHNHSIPKPLMQPYTGLQDSGTGKLWEYAESIGERCCFIAHYRKNTENLLGNKKDPQACPYRLEGLSHNGASDNYTISGAVGKSNVSVHFILLRSSQVPACHAVRVRWSRGGHRPAQFPG